ncbi:MAG TPA: Panacea domain-containing protein [Rudaea sp.]|jgi:uncharacterized phage-associated protein
MTSANTFDAAKTMHLVAYLARNTGASLYSVLKMMYLADKKHLERFGRFIVNDHYAALPKGPVPSRTYDALKAVREGRFEGDAVAAKGLLRLCGTSHQFTIEGDPDLMHFSKSDIRCLDEVIEVYKKRGHWHVYRASHDKAWHAARPNATMSPAAIASTLKNSTELIQHLADPYPDKAEREVEPDAVPA